MPTRTTNRQTSVAIAAAMCILAGFTHAGDPASAPSLADTPAASFSASMTRLQEAAQRLREAIQTIAREPTGPRRNAAVEQAHAALFDAQQAMIMLPPELRAGTGHEQSDYTRSIEGLKHGAHQLRAAVQEMALQPSGKRRNQAAERTREALLETQKAMIWLPPALRREIGDNAANSSVGRTR